MCLLCTTRHRCDDEPFRRYLKISISDFLTLFAARTRGPFWSRAPSPPLVAAFALATVVATIISIAVDVPDNTYPMHHISLKAACFVWVWNLLFFALQDGAKLAVYAVIDRRARRREAALAAKVGIRDRDIDLLS